MGVVDVSDADGARRPPHLVPPADADLDGYHWIRRGDGLEVAYWLAGKRCWARVGELFPASAAAVAAAGWGYAAPVAPPPEATEPAPASAPADERLRLADELARMAQGSRDLAEEARVVAAHFRPEFEGLRVDGGGFRDETAARRALQLRRLVVDREREARNWSSEAEDLDRAAAALRAAVVGEPSLPPPRPPQFEDRSRAVYADEWQLGREARSRGETPLEGWPLGRRRGWEAEDLALRELAP